MDFATSRPALLRQYSTESWGYSEAPRISRVREAVYAPNIQFIGAYSPSIRKTIEPEYSQDEGVASHQGLVFDQLPRPQSFVHERVQSTGYFETSGMLSSSSHRRSISYGGMIVLQNYAPVEGERGVPIVVDIELRTGVKPGYAAQEPAMPSSLAQSRLELRIVLGQAALPTNVSVLQEDMRHNESIPDARSLRVRAIAPSYSDVRFPETYSVPLFLQVISSDTVIDELFVGPFTYWEHSESRVIFQLWLF